VVYEGQTLLVVESITDAHREKLREMLANNPSGPININADRRALKLFLDMIHYVPMPGSFVWSMRDRLFPLCAELDSKSAMERALSLCLDCPQRDPWGMFVAAGKNNFIPLARVALWELAREEEVRTGTFNMFGHHAHHGMNMNYFNLGGEGQFGPLSPSTVSSPQSMSSKRSSKAVPAPSLHNLTAANLDGVPAAFMLGLLNAVMEASKDGAPLTWASVAARFEPVLTEERQLSKKAQKQMLAQQYGSPMQQHQPHFQINNAQSPQHHMGHMGMGGAGLGLNFDPQQASFMDARTKQQMMGKQRGMQGHPQAVMAK